MSTRYLEINSTYRNRADYPNASSFEVICGNFNGEIFPQLTSFPIYTFQSNAYGTVMSGGGATQTPFINSSVSRPSLDLTGWPYDIYTLAPRYSGYHMYMYPLSGIPPLPGGPIDNKIIVRYNSTTSTFTLETPLNQTPDSNPLSPGVTNAAYLLDISPFKQIDNMLDNTTYQGPAIYFNLQYPSPLYNQYPVLTATPYVGYYLMNDFSYGTPEGNIITSLDSDTLTITTDRNFSSISITTFFDLIQTRRFSIRKTLPKLVGSTITKSFTILNTVTLDAYASSENDAYKGMYLYIRPSTGDSFFPNIIAGRNTFYIYVFKILRYDGTTKTAYLDRDVGAWIGANEGYEIMQNTEPSWNPLIYTGSSVVRPDPICMTVGLTSLILPNVTLTTGARIAFYPYVYVELRNSTSSKTVGKDIIYSNNPNAHSAIFVVPITDIRNPSRAPFIKLKSKMKQTIKFKPNDNFIFRVYLPDGTPFQTLESDSTFAFFRPDGSEENLSYTLLPLPPNPLLQIEAVFNYTPV